MGGEGTVIKSLTKESLHCINCRQDYAVTSLLKIPADGSTKVKDSTRYSLFCNVCKNFIALVDPTMGGPKTK